VNEPPDAPSLYRVVYSESARITFREFTARALKTGKGRRSSRRFGGTGSALAPLPAVRRTNHRSDARGRANMDCDDSTSHGTVCDL